MLNNYGDCCNIFRRVYASNYQKNRKILSVFLQQIYKKLWKREGKGILSQVIITNDKFFSEVLKMMEKEKIAQLKKEIKFLREKLGETISKENDYINAGKALRISKELDELIVEYYNCSSSGKSS